MRLGVNELPMLAELLAVIGGQHDQRPPVDLSLLQARDQLAHALVERSHPRQIALEQALARGFVDLVGVMTGPEQIAGGALSGRRTEPLAAGFLQSGRETRRRPVRPPVPPIGGIGVCVVVVHEKEGRAPCFEDSIHRVQRGSRHPLGELEAMLDLLVALEAAAEAEAGAQPVGAHDPGRRVARRRQQLGKRCEPVRQAIVPRENAVNVGRRPRQHRHVRRQRERNLRHGRGELDGLRDQPVDVRRHGDALGATASQCVGPQRIERDQDHRRERVGRRGPCRSLPAAEEPRRRRHHQREGRPAPVPKAPGADRDQDVTARASSAPTRVARSAPDRASTRRSPSRNCRRTGSSWVHRRARRRFRS